MDNCAAWALRAYGARSPESLCAKRHIGQTVTVAVPSAGADPIVGDPQVNRLTSCVDGDVEARGLRVPDDVRQRLVNHRKQVLNGVAPDECVDRTGEADAWRATDPVRGIAGKCHDSARRPLECPP